MNFEPDPYFDDDSARAKPGPERVKREPNIKFEPGTEGSEWASKKTRLDEPSPFTRVRPGMVLPGMEPFYTEAPGEPTPVFTRERQTVALANKSDPVLAGDPDKRYRYHISKHIDSNRDLYFIKLVAGALKRRSFQTLIEVEEKEDRQALSYIDVSVKYSYNNELLYAWSTAIEKVKKMIEESVRKSNTRWQTSESIHEELINNDTAVLSLARYAAFILMTETNNFIPRNRTGNVLRNEQKIEGERVLDMMKALHNEFGVLRADLVQRYRV